MPVVMWITGLPGSGKSTIAEELVKRLPGFIILRIDELRRIVTPKPTYSEQEREYVYRALVFAAKKLYEAGHDVIIDATGNLRRWRELARKELDNFIEIYLKCSLQTCSQREKQRSITHHAPRDIYRKAKQGWPVPGVNVPYEEPLNPDLVLNTEETEVSEAVDRIVALLNKA